MLRYVKNIQHTTAYLRINVMPFVVNECKESIQYCHLWKHDLQHISTFNIPPVLVKLQLCLSFSLLQRHSTIISTINNNIIVLVIITVFILDCSSLHLLCTTHYLSVFYFFLLFEQSKKT